MAVGKSELSEWAEHAPPGPTRDALLAACGRAPAPATLNPATKPGIRLPRPRKISKAEMEYRARLLQEFPGKTITAGLSFLLSSGCRYTPDWTVWDGAKILLAVEVKGSYRLHSAGRANLAFKTAIVEYPAIQWRYAEKTTGGDWTATNTTPTP